MLISTEINPFQGYGDVKKVIKMLKDAGFTAYDYSMFSHAHANLVAEDYKERAKEIRAYADSIGIVCNQTHAPFPTVVTERRMPLNESVVFNEKSFEIVKRAIEFSGILGAKICVVHPCNDHGAEENAKFYLCLEETARTAGVKIALENMWNWYPGDTHASPAACSHHDDFKKHLDLLPKDVFVACVDIGHAEMFGLDTSAVKMLETLGDRVEAMHLHDVDGTYDNHAIPFNQKIKYAPIIETLRKIGYKGDVTLESEHPAVDVPVELIPAAATYMAAIANYFKNEIEK